LRYRGAFYLDVGNWERAWSLWIYILQLEQHYLHPLSLATSSTFYAFIEAFTMLTDQMMLRPYHRLNPNYTPKTEQIIAVLDRAVYEAERFIIYHRIAFYLFHRILGFFMLTKAAKMNKCGSMMITFSSKSSGT
jgi:hypothetical protein